MTRTISQALSDAEDEAQSAELASTSAENADGSNGKGGSANLRYSVDHRIEPEELDKVYLNVPTVHNAINKRAQLVLSRDRTLEGDNAGFFRTFLDLVGQRGGDVSWEQIHEIIYKHQYIYGEAFIEILYDEKGEIKDMTYMDPTRMDYAKDRNGNILLDDAGDPVGYTQQIPPTAGGRYHEQVFDVPDEVSNLHNRRYFPADKIAHFKYNTVRDGFYPIGLVEPGYRAAERSFQLQEDYANKAHTTLFPTRVLKVGDERHEPSPQKIRTASQKLRSADSDTEMVVPYWMDLDMFEPENPDAMLDFFKEFSEEVITASGVPKAFVRGGGEVNRATLESQRQMLNTSLEHDVTSTARQIEKKLFEPIARTNGKTGYPTLEYEGYPDDSIDEETEEENAGMPYTLGV